ncbi:helix-turn-helix domain-containing protein [Sphingomonas aurantiaca]|uniref:Crp/Fnr family transcriptional regulator n=1 Tax=Sphingomonas aurantiaca TaxID=185949 RepID=UPI002FE3FF1C
MQGVVDASGYELPMSQEQLGDALGLTAVHVNRTIKSLEADGLISRNRRRISFPRWEALREPGRFFEPLSASDATSIVTGYRLRA